MNEERPNPKTDQSTNVKSVTFVGNSWILCRSTTYEGRIYYFNTLSGESVWNLSESEIEKAKQHSSKVLKLNPGVIEFQCPEPKEPPISNTPSNNELAKRFLPRNYNKQIVRAEFSTQSPPLTIEATQCANYQHVGLGSVSQVLNTSAFNLNPQVWTLPNSQQILITPCISANSSSFQQPMNLPSTSFYHQNTPTRFTKQGGSFGRTFNSSTKYTRNHARSFNSMGTHQNYARRHNSKTFNNTAITDLRQLILSKTNKLEQDGFDIEEVHTAEVPDHTNKVNEIDEQRTNNEELKNKAPSCQSITGDYQNTDSFNVTTEAKNENNSGQTVIDNVNCTDSILTERNEKCLHQEQQLSTMENVRSIKPISRYDRLWKLADKQRNLEKWFILADTEIYINNIDFLKEIILSDSRCVFLLPNPIILELQKSRCATTSDTMTRSRYAFKYIMTQVDAKRALIDNQVSGANITDIILDCCRRYSDQNYHLVVLSNNEELQKHKTSALHIFTMLEITDFLSPVPLYPCRWSDGNTNESVKCVDVQTEAVLVQRDTATQKVDAFVQTEDYTDSAKRSCNCNYDCNKDELDQKDNVKSTVHNHSKIADENLESSCYKNRKIRLKGSTPTQISSTETNSSKDDKGKPNLNIAKKQFKWRRRRNLPQNCEVVSSSTDADIVTSRNVNQKNIFNDVAPSNFEPLESQDRSDIADDNSLSEISIGSITQRNVTKAKVVIEESSSSGVISNSTFNDDSQSSYSVSYKMPESTTNEIEKDKHLTFEVIDEVVQNNIITRRDEWLSRFVQIIEEILTQVLLNCPNVFKVKPPWTIIETLDCVIQTFSKNQNILDVAIKLSKIVEFFLGEQANKHKNFIPMRFMEMYKLGVKLLELIQEVMNCEDLQTAVRLLEKLNHDMCDPNFNTFCDMELNDRDSGNVSCNNDGIIESPIVNNTIADSDNSDNMKCALIEKANYNLRSSKRKSSESTESFRILKRSNSEMAFFSSLSLQKKQFYEQHTKENRTSSEISIKSPEWSQNNCVEVEHSKEVTENKTSDIDNVGDTSDVIDKDEVSTKCLVYTGKEYKLKKNEEPLDLDKLDYTGDDDSYHSESDHEDPLEATVENPSTDENFDDVNTDIDDVSTLKILIQCIRSEILETFLEIRSFCEQCGEFLLNPTNKDKKCEIREIAQNARVHVTYLHKTLISICDRVKPVSSENNVESDLSINPGNIKSIVYLDEYRSTVAECKNLADIILRSLNLILDAVTMA